MSRRTGTVVAAVALWLVIVASTSTVAWQVIDRAGRGVYLTDGARPELTQTIPRTSPEPTTGGATSATPSRSSPVKSSTHSSRPQPSRTTPTSAAPAPTSARPTPDGTASRPTPRPSPSTAHAPSTSAPPRPPVVSDSVSVAGGSVGVSCQGATLTLRFATPRNGWSYVIDRSESEIEVAFRQGGGGQESEVHARCSRGAPAFETSSSDGGDGGDG